MKIFSVKVLRFTIRYYRTVDLMRISNIAQNNRSHQEEGRTIPETSYDKPSFQQKCKNECWKKKHFGKNLKYHKIFNKDNIKVSYSCMDNMKKL